MKNDASLIAFDGLHPSAKEYAKWAALLVPVIAKVLK
jgi:lysophospholipase L1-like esterase